MSYDTPKLTKEHQKLEKFVGEWEGEETMHPSPWLPEGGKAKGRYSIKLDLDGFWLVFTYQQKMNKKITYKARGIVGYDTTKKQYTMNWFENHGSGAYPSTGTLERNKLTVEHEDERGKHRYSFAMAKPDVLKFVGEMSHDGGQSWSTWMDGKYTRKS